MPAHEPMVEYYELADAFLQRQLGYLLRALAPLAATSRDPPQDSLTWWVLLLTNLAGLCNLGHEVLSMSGESLLPQEAREQLRPRAETVSRTLSQMVDRFNSLPCAIAYMTTAGAARLIALHMWDPSVEAAELAFVCLFPPSIPAELAADWKSMARILVA